MRLPLLKLAVIASILALPVAARADIIDDFTFTSSSHTIFYSLPGSFTFAELPSPLIQSFSESAPTTIDGAAGYNVSGTYYLPPGYLGDNLLLYLPSSIFGSSPVGFGGATFFSYTAQGSPVTITATFAPGTYSLDSASSSGITPYTLTIRQEAATTPEPWSLTLLATGIASLIGLAGIRHLGSIRLAGCPIPRF